MFQIWGVLNEGQIPLNFRSFLASKLLVGSEKVWDAKNGTDVFAKFGGDNVWSVF